MWKHPNRLRMLFCLVLWRCEASFTWEASFQGENLEASSSWPKLRFTPAGSPRTSWYPRKKASQVQKHIASDYITDFKFQEAKKRAVDLGAVSWRIRSMPDITRVASLWSDWEDSARPFWKQPQVRHDFSIRAAISASNEIELQALEIHVKTIHPNRGKERLNWCAWFLRDFWANAFHI